MIGYLNLTHQLEGLLNRVNRRSLVFVIFFIFINYSCINGDKKKELNINQHDIEILKGDRLQSYRYVLSLVGKVDYECIYNQLNDSVSTWLTNKTVNIDYPDSVFNCRIDTLLCINKEKNKLITILMNQCHEKDAVMDEMIFIYGVLIKNRWYFFSGPGLALPREYYQVNIHRPLSFKMMQLIATKEIYNGYLEKMEDGRFDINNEFFQDITSVAWGQHTTQAEWDSTYLQIVKDNWKNIIKK